MALRKIGATVKPVLTITVAGAGLKMKSVSTFKTIEMDIKLNEDTEEKTPDGRTVKVNNNNLAVVLHVRESALL